MADYILGIESSCDDTSAAVLRDGVLLSNVIASQQVHKDFGGVVPELASRAHEQNIVPVVSEALRRAGVEASQLSAIAFTRGPGLLGSLLVGTSFAKALSLSLDIPMVMVNHLQGHILANFVRQPDVPVREPSFPYLCLLVSGGNSQIVKVNSPLEYEILGQTIDDAVGEAFDKCSKMLGLGYPGGPVIDRLAKQGDPNRFQFAKPNIPGLDYSFSGPDDQAHPRRQGNPHPGNHHRRRRQCQQRPPGKDCGRRRKASLEHLPAGIQVHHRQRRDDSRGRLVPVQGRCPHPAGRGPRLPYGRFLGPLEMSPIIPTFEG